MNRISLIRASRVLLASLRRYRVGLGIGFTIPPTKADMGRRWRSREKESHSEGKSDDSRAVILVSSDDDEANEDLSLEIVNKCRLRELKRRRDEDKEKDSSFFYDLSISSADEITVIPSGSASEVKEEIAAKGAEETKKKRKKKLKKKKRKEVEEEVAVTEVPCAPSAEVESTVPTSSVIEVNETSNNVVLRKLLRGPRYFDSGHESWESCYNCGEEGHIAANCKEERRQRPCFVCGIFGHNAKSCMQGKDCFICKRKGHHAKDCPHKYENNSQESIICLRCGDLGHDMASCRNNYATSDMKEIQCYICKKYGHLCCVDYNDSGPSEISCYNCAEPGHTGQGCVKQRGENNASTPSSLFCYSCGQEGHFARGCTKGPKSVKRYGESSAPLLKNKESSKDSKSFHKRNGESSTPISWSKKAKKDMKGSKISKSSAKHYGESSTPVRRSKDKYKKDSKITKSLPKNYERNHAKGSPSYFNGSPRAVKSNGRGGWMVDHTINLPERKHMINGWSSSPITPSGRGNQNYSTFINGYSSSHAPSSGSHYSTPYTPHQRNMYYAGTPNSRGFTGGYRHGFTPSRYGNPYDYYG